MAGGENHRAPVIQDLGRKPGRSWPGGSPPGVQCCLSTSDNQAVDSHCLQHQHETAAGLAVAARGPDVSPGVTPADWDEARTSLGLLRELSGIPVVHGREDVNEHRLYLPERWTKDPGWWREAGIPEAVVFANDPQVVELLQGAGDAKVPCGGSPATRRCQPAARDHLTTA
jgi:hypothetical protein